MERIETRFWWGTAVTVIARDFCGSVVIEFNDRYTDGYIGSLCVSERDRNKGHGTELITEAERIIKEYGRNDATLYVEKDQWLVDWYKRLGYEIVENTSGDDHYYTMGKKLN